MIPNQDLTRPSSISDYGKLELGFRTRVNPRKMFPSRVSIFFARINAPHANRSCSFSLNGSDLEQIVHNRIGILSLEWVEI